MNGVQRQVGAGLSQSGQNGIVYVAGTANGAASFGILGGIAGALIGGGKGAAIGAAIGAGLGAIFGGFASYETLKAQAGA